VSTGPNHSMGIKIETEQKVSMLSLELAQERIRELERVYAHRHRRVRTRREARIRPLRRLRLILR
jgi:hypothetical protein